MADCAVTFGWMKSPYQKASAWLWLDRLASSTYEVLIAAAVSGRVFTSEIVGAVAGTSEDTLVEAFDEAERARLLARGKIPGELMFSHELIRQTVLF